MISKCFGFLLLLASFVCIYLFESKSNASGILRVLHWPAIFLTGVGPIGLLMVCVDGYEIVETIQLGLQTPSRLRKFLSQEKVLMRQLCVKFYSQGASCFEAEAGGRLTSQVFQTVLEKLSLRISVSDVKGLLEHQKETDEAILRKAIKLVGLAVRLTPSVGMLGTILGMVQLLESLKDPSEIGSHMSLALLTTFFGLFFSLAVWTPAQHRLQSILDVKLLEFEQVYHWLTLLENRKPSEYLSDGRELKKSKRTLPK